MANHRRETTITVSLKDLDVLIRRAVREELSDSPSAGGGVLYLDPGTPLHDDLKEISGKKKRIKK